MDINEADDNLGSGWSYGPWTRVDDPEEPETGRALLPLKLRSPTPATDGGLVTTSESAADATEGPLYAGCDWDEFLDPTIHPGDVNELGRNIVCAYLDDPLLPLSEIAADLECEEELVHKMLAKGTQSDQYTEETFEECFGDGEPDPESESQSAGPSDGIDEAADPHSEVMAQNAEATTSTEPTQSTTTQDKTLDDLPDSQQNAIDEFFHSPDRNVTTISKDLDHDPSYLSSLRSRKTWAFEQRLEQLLEDPEIDNSEIRTNVWDGSNRKQDQDQESETEEPEVETAPSDESADQQQSTSMDQEQDVSGVDFDPTRLDTDDLEVETAGVSSQGPELGERLDVALESVTKTIQSGEIDDPEQERLLLDNYRILIDLVEAKRSLAAPELDDMG